MGAEEPVAPPLRVVVGLGNPGSEYVGTRHNVGFEIVDRLTSVPFERQRKWKAEIARPPGGEEVFVKPQTFMNLSGRAVASVSGFYKCPPEQILVVYDDLSLPFGQLRFRKKGSAGGHNGIRSIIESLGCDRFPRLKVGIGAPGGEPGGELSGFVLGRFSPEERLQLEKYLDHAADAVRYALAHGTGAAMNAFNGGSPSLPSNSPPDNPPLEATE